MGNTKIQVIEDRLDANKNGEGKGIYCICSSNNWVVEASIKFAVKSDSFVLIESTSNQVNQFGGYTGMNPEQFAGFVLNLAEKHKLSRDKVILGGDHLGPNPWQNEPANKAMENAKQLIRDCILAGYKKIHLDASMHCADDDPNIPLDVGLSVERAADLCLVAERSASTFREKNSLPLYVIGTEVPPAGGATSAHHDIEVTPVEDVEETIELTRAAFVERGLESAWDRVAAVVVQPGVEFGDQSIDEYKRENTRQLVEFIETQKKMVYEAHSTDYQFQQALQEMVEDHFAILKVGPELTFAFREAIFALEMIEKAMLDRRADIELSNVGQVIDEAMVANPQYWQKYYLGDESELAFARKYSLSDRIRYYWPVPEVKGALAKLENNLSNFDIPPTLLSQFFPHQYQGVAQGKLKGDYNSLIEDKIEKILLKYTNACRINQEI
jgi:D-tagatose-1,6-bisphosphate aldolase subunit GatZ/KbaZ